MFRINIVGAGLAGLSAAVHLARNQIGCRLISVQTSERAQSVLAEGGINAAMNVSGEDDTAAEHFANTMRGGVYLADPAAVRGMAENAPEIIRDLLNLGVPFNMEGDLLVQRNFGGQKKKRTAYARSSTGKALMTAMIDAARRFETEGPGRGRTSGNDAAGEAGGMVSWGVAAEIAGEKASSGIAPGEASGAALSGIAAEKAGGAALSGIAAGIKAGKVSLGAGDGEPLIRRYSHHRFLKLKIREGICCGVITENVYTGEVEEFEGPVILAFGGPNGLFPGRTTGTTANDGCALAEVFAQGVELANLEFIQYHPTTVQIAGKRMLVSEAARGEGGRLYAMRDGQPWYFMEEKYPELGNLMPRDVVSREMDRVVRDPSCEFQVYLDLTGLSRKVWEKRLPDLRKQIIYYLAVDPAKKPIPVSPGIHFFMGGILVDRKHRTNIPGLYAAGECACQYHGANRLGGNSLLGALYGGRTAAETAACEMGENRNGAPTEPDITACESNEIRNGVPTEPDITACESNETGSSAFTEPERAAGQELKTDPAEFEFSAQTAEKAAEILARGLAIVRDNASMEKALRLIRELAAEVETGTHADHSRLRLAEAMLLCALARRESRGAHTRTDYPEKNDEAFKKTTTVVFEKGEIRISFRDIPES